MIPKSPITGKDNVVLEKEIPSSFLINEYKREFGMNVEKFFKNIKTVCLYRCFDTGYRFFTPFTVAGDDAFYQELQKFPWYYMDEKWEHGIASQFIKKEDKVLEIGCARGGFLKKISKAGAKAEGLEMNSDTLLYCKKTGLAVYPDSIETFSRKKGLYYDIVCSFQVLEHIPEVKNFLEASLAVLKPGGLMIISIPNNDCLIFTDDSILLNMPPHHVGRWNINSLITLQNHFEMEIEAIYIEPFQEYHLGYALKIANRSVEERLNKKIGLFAFLFKKISKLITYTGISAVSKHLIGHSILVVFKKK
ncbi:MAG: class I SAM-dependent methyltransferase [Candidatus Parcubacteria bacterium]|nr:class I SAM-dependent methyltransferase [Candidatus Parcubacteria bacterium]